VKRFIFKLPDVGEGTAEAEIVAWHVKAGDHVEEGRPLVDVMTDKATVELTAPVSGKVLATHGAVGTMAAVGAPIAEFETASASADTADMQETPPPPPGPKAAPAPEAAPEPPPEAKPPAPAEVPAAPTPQGRRRTPLASPAVRRRAKEMGIALAEVPGSGPGGRVRHQDLDSHRARVAPGGQTHLYARRQGIEAVKVIGLRRRIAARMAEAHRHIPHFAYVEEIDMTELEALRQHLNLERSADKPKLTVLPFLIRALVRLLPDFPRINAHFDADAGTLHCHRAVHVGIATQTAAGLMVPVLRHAEARDIWDCAGEIARLAAAARDGTIARDALAGSTITLTSLGPLGGIAATPIINHPEVAIIGPNKIVERPVVAAGQISVRKMMNLSSSFDHRIVDGHDAALFIQRLKKLLEHPATLFMN